LVKLLQKCQDHNTNFFIDCFALKMCKVDGKEFWTSTSTAQDTAAATAAAHHGTAAGLTCKTGR
jgi:hypothetical protein